VRRLLDTSAPRGLLNHCTHRSGRFSTCMCDRLRYGPRELIARQIDLFCALHSMSTKGPAAAQNGGYTRAGANRR